MGEHELAPIKKATRTYGRKARRGSPPPAALPPALFSTTISSPAPSPPSSSPPKAATQPKTQATRAVASSSTSSPPVDATSGVTRRPATGKGKGKQSIEDDTLWDEDVALAARRQTASTLTSSSRAASATLARAPSGDGKMVASASPKAPVSKRAVTAPGVSPSPKRSRPSTPSNDHTPASTGSRTPTKRDATPPPKRSKVSSDTPSRSRTTTPVQTTPKSPAKDLSKVFERFAVDSGSPAVSPRRGKELGRSNSAIAASLGARSKSSTSLLSDNGTPEKLQRSLSQPTVSPSTKTQLLHATTSLPTPPVVAPPLSSTAPPSTNPASTLALAPRSKRTYGASRTIRASSSHLASLDAAVDPAQSQTYHSLRAEWGIEDEETLDEENSQAAEAGLEVKSVTLLRAKGENKRFGDEFEYLVEGLQGDMGIAVKRASALDVLRKIDDPDFVRKLKAAELLERVYRQFRSADAGRGDLILDPALAFLICILVKDQRVAEVLLRIESLSNHDNGESDVIEALVTMLARVGAADQILGDVPKKGCSKSDLRSMKTLREIIDRSTVLSAGHALPVSLRTLCLSAISTISSFSSRPTFKPHDMICSAGALGAVATAFVAEATVLELRLSSYQSGLELLPSDGSVNLHLLDNLLLRTMEACTSSTPLALHILSSPSYLTSLSKSFSTLLLGTHILAASSSSSLPERKADDGRKAMDLLLASLKFLVEISTAVPDWGVALANQTGLLEIVLKILLASREPAKGATGETMEDEDGLEDTEEDENMNVEDSLLGPDGIRRKDHREKMGKGSEARLDVLCMALGLLSNLVEAEEKVKVELRDTLINADCKELRRCARGCQCAGRRSAVHHLTELYLHPAIKDIDELHVTFVKGYTGLLLGLLMLDQPLNQQLILLTLEGHDAKLEELLSQWEGFATTHDEREAGSGERLRELVQGVRSR